MLNRIGAAVDAYAASVALDGSYVTYCYTQLGLATRHEPDGSIPYGVNYNTIRTEQELRSIIEVREAFETNYLRL